LISYPGSRVSQVNSSFFSLDISSFKFFFSISSFNIRLLGLELHEFFYFFFFGIIPISYLGSWVSQVNLGCSSFFWYFFNWLFFQFRISSFRLLESWHLFLFNFFYTLLSRSHDRAVNLSCWLKSGFFVFFSKLIFFSLSFNVWFTSNFFFHFMRLFYSHLIFTLLSNKIIEAFLKYLECIFL
jgi:hypothetical protein